MTKTEKIYIPSSDLGYIVEANYSPIVYDKFFIDFKNIEVSKQNVVIK